jgi:ribonucleoside-diphosphate reductase alpha chain
MDRKVRQRDGSYKRYRTANYGYRLFRQLFPNAELPSYMVTTDDLSVTDHIAIQAAAQRWVDASVSKTVNIRKDATYEQFVQVYELAYQLGCKGCTTYRPSEIRGVVITRAGTSTAGGSNGPGGTTEALAKRPETLSGSTRRIKWPTLNASLYLTVNYLDSIPHEVFFNSKDARLHDWMVATSLMITSILRRGGEVGFIAKELQQVQSLHDNAFVQGPHDDHPRNYHSLISLIGSHLEDLLTAPALTKPNGGNGGNGGRPEGRGEHCPSCGGMTVFRNESCKTCVNCGYSDCN